MRERQYSYQKIRKQKKILVVFNWTKITLQTEWIVNLCKLIIQSALTICFEVISQIQQQSIVVLLQIEIVRIDIQSFQWTVRVCERIIRVIQPCFHIVAG